MALYDVIIIGAGPAGMTAAIYAARANMNVLLLEKLAPGGQIINTHEIQNYTGVGTINGAELAYKMFEHTQELNVAFDYGTVKEIKEEGNIKIITCEEEDKIFEAKTVILATGTVPRRLGVENEDRFAGENISWCAICDGAYYRDKDVVVIGGGNSAVEEAIYLASLAKSVKVVTLFDLTADPVSCDELREQANVTIYEYHNVEGFTGEEKLKGVRIKSTQTDEEQELLCDGAFEYIGLKPSTEAFKSLGVLDKYGYVEVNNRMETKVSGVYGAGDVVTKELRQVVTACSDGAVAAQVASKYIKTI
ncbi:NAD(P)/FAD-dependent oxidoreductase [Niameybacter sp.]|uniref:NAD(P)/FAD-dependent oxidoreductase n=1 Tax=Niameybacter sp. TaxID=2033640 RepID=UPI002FC89D12